MADWKFMLYCNNSFRTENIVYCPSTYTLFNYFFIIAESILLDKLFDNKIII